MNISLVQLFAHTILGIFQWWDLALRIMWVHTNPPNVDTEVWYHCKLYHSHILIGLLWSQVRASHFEGLITTIVGYVLLAVTLIVCHVSFHTACCLCLLFKLWVWMTCITVWIWWFSHKMHHKCIKLVMIRCASACFPEWTFEGISCIG